MSNPKNPLVTISVNGPELQTLIGLLNAGIEKGVKNIADVQVAAAVIGKLREALADHERQARPVPASDGDE